MALAAARRRFSGCPRLAGNGDGGVENAHGVVESSLGLIVLAIGVDLPTKIAAGDENENDKDDADELSVRKDGLRAVLEGLADLVGF